MGLCSPMRGKYLSTYIGAQSYNFMDSFLTTAISNVLRHRATSVGIYGLCVYVCMFPVAGCPLHCAAGRVSMRAHLVTCGSFQRASQYASLYGYLRFCQHATRRASMRTHTATHAPPPSGADQTCSNSRRLRPRSPSPSFVR